MARRRKEGLADLLVVLPWWVSAGLGCAAFVVLRWIMPATLGHNPILTGVVAGTHALAWPALLFFGVVGVIAFVKARASTAVRSNQEVTGRPKGFSDAHSNEPAVILDRKVWGALEDGSKSSAPVEKNFTAWSLEALRALEWKRFELLCAKYYEMAGFKSETIRCGPDGGIDVKLFKVDPTKPLAVVQCKAWNRTSVGVKEVRELLGVMAHEKVGRGIFITTGTYTKDAAAFGSDNPIQLLDGGGFLGKIQALPQAQLEALFAYAFDGDYRTPTCPSCGIKMTKRESQRGPFWGCLHYPRCRSTFALRTKSA